jgi:alpha-D-ribose 1-methylphosphonate 5-triphosphate synthase subunit PhnI
MYVAVKGGEQAIRKAHELLAEKRRGDFSVPELTVDQVASQLTLAVDRVMTEGSLYDRELAALAVKQARGDLIEAIFLLRAFRNTLPRLGVTLPIDTSKMIFSRRISAAFKDLPGGQILGPTFDYTHRLLDFSLLSGQEAGEVKTTGEVFSLPAIEEIPRVSALLEQEGLIEVENPDPEDRTVEDLTRQPIRLPADRDLRLQNLVRGDEGFLLGLAYSTQRGFGNTHPFVGEIRLGEVAIEVIPEELGFPIQVGEITVTECQMITQFKGSSRRQPTFTSGYGLTFGHCERKAMAMALTDRALRRSELEETTEGPAQDEEFVLMHSDNIEASGFVEHLKLPHHVDFQAELSLVRSLKDQVKRAKAREDEGK